MFLSCFALVLCQPGRQVCVGFNVVVVGIRCCSCFSLDDDATKAPITESDSIPLQTTTSLQAENMVRPRQ